MYEKCNVEILLTPRNAWFIHLKSKTHLENEPDQCRKICEKFNIAIGVHSWPRHLRSKTHMENDPDQTTKQSEFIKLCEKYNVKFWPMAWNARLKSKRHLSNEPDDSRKVCENVISKYFPINRLDI